MQPAASPCSEPPRRSLENRARRALSWSTHERSRASVAAEPPRGWAAAAGFWLFVSAMSAAQTLWIAQTPGQRIDVRGAIAWQTTYFVAWIPFTIGVWQFTRGWLPERFGGWPRLLLAHLRALRRRRARADAGRDAARARRSRTRPDDAGELPDAACARG